MIKKLPDNIWFPFWVEKWIFGSMRLECSPEERAVWVDLLALAAKDSGYIRANEETPYLMKQLAGLLIYNESFFKQTIDKFIKKGKLQIDKNGILYITKWDKYSFSPSRKRVEKHRLIKKGKETVTPIVTNVADGVTHNITKHNITKHNKEDIYTPKFLQFWDNYPRKMRKKEAYIIWSRLTKKQQDEIIIASKNYADMCINEGTEEKYMLYPKSFLNKKRERWKDYLKEPEQLDGWAEREVERLKKEGEKNAS